VAVGGSGVGVGPAVGIKLGKVGVMGGVSVGRGGIKVAVGPKAGQVGSTTNSSIIAEKTKTTNPVNTPITNSCERVTSFLLKSSFSVYFTHF
jgi:hypothetical protein